MAEERVCELLIIGAGVGGSSLAIRAARQGVRTRLLEKSAFPRDKVCGCTLNRRSVRLLEEVGIDVSQFADPITKVDLGYKQFLAEGTWVCSRRKLDEVLVETAVAAGARFEDSTAFREQKARLRVIATGLGGGKPFGFTYRSLSRRRLVGLSTIVPDSCFPQGTLRMRLYPWGYVGTVRLEDGRLDIAAAVRPADVRRARKDMERDLFDGEKQRWFGTPALNVAATALSMPGQVLLGDAAFYAEPFTGEGMGWALEGASLLDDFLPELLSGESARWESCYRQLFWRRSRSSRYLMPLLSQSTLAVVSPFAGALVNQRLWRAS